MTIVDNKKAVVVLGFHRGGTSAVSGALALYGLALPNSLMEPVIGENDKGFWESVLLSKFNNDLLLDQGEAWDRLTYSGLISDRKVDDEDIITDLCDLIDKEFNGNAQTILVKDPRICKLLPLWETALMRCGYSCSYVLVVRSPNECALSLQERNGISKPLSMLLWMQYMLSAEKQTRKANRVILDYHDLLSKPDVMIADLVSRLDINIEVTNNVADKVKSFIDPGLQHYISDSSLDDESNQLPKILFHLLKNLEQTSNYFEIDDCVQNVEKYAALHSQIIESKEQQFNVAMQELNILEEKIDVVQQTLTAVSVRVKVLDEALTASNKVRDELLLNLSEIEESVSFLHKKNEALDRSVLGRLLERIKTATHFCQRNVLFAGLYFMFFHPKQFRQMVTGYLGVRKSGCFDSKYYLQSNCELQSMLTEPLLHYISVGHRLGCNPSQDFNETEYKNINNLSKDIVGLFHWYKSNY